MGHAEVSQAKTGTEPDSPNAAKIFQDGAVILVPFTVSRTAKPGNVVLGGVLQAQICQEPCYPATKVNVTAKVTVPALP